MKPLFKRIRQDKNELLARIREGSDRAFKRPSARLLLIFSLLVAVLAPMGVAVAAMYVVSLMEELEYYSYFLYSSYYVILTVCTLAIQMLLIGTARIAVKTYNGEKTEVRDVLFAFKGKAFWKHLLYSVAACGIIEFFVGIISVVIDAFDTIQKSVELNGLSGAGMIVIAMLAIFAVCVIFFPASVRLVPIPFLMALYPEESFVSIVRTSYAITRAGYGEAFTLSFKMLAELALSALLLFVPWIVVFGPSRAVSFAGFAVETVKSLELPETDSRILPDGVDSAPTSSQDN